MKLEKLIIRNFRGIGFAAIDIEEFTTLVGPNNIGKSTILNAIHLVLDNKKPRLEDWPGQKPSDQPMEIQCVFGKLEEWERGKPAISQLLYGDKLKVRMLAEWNAERTDYSYDYSVYNTETKFPWSDENFTNAKKDSTCKAIFDEVGISTASDFKDRIAELEQYTLANHPDHVIHSEDWHVKKFANSLQQAVPHVMYVPASFKIEDELKATNNSPFSFLFTKRLFPKVKGDGAYKDYIDKAGLLQKNLKVNLKMAV